jgi:hypothetical protein
MIELEACRIRHLHAIAADLRAEEKFELGLLGVEKPRHAMLALYKGTLYPMAALVDGKTAAAWGDAAPPLSREGLLWFFSAAIIESVPVSFAKIARREIIRMMIGREVLRSSVHKSCDRALRFYRMLGFETIEGTMVEGFIEIRMAR